MLNVIMLNVIMLNVVMLNVIILSVIILNVSTPSHKLMVFLVFKVTALSQCFLCTQK
jgi:hypothetical protein